ncbi:hypothetical protein [Sulfolobus sp. E11-6]|uniref:hypothetical protein n=1 Tax=Sulfolobus sp. E11-6 TaxID=2663020 RepID=UPI0012957301|nr:hypothetical protein [Sulfolobus sp. E11-6]QGA68893.1 hypothetical protein GFS33_09325 [Sulfolobus sp. E11-6]
MSIISKVKAMKLIHDVLGLGYLELISSYISGKRTVKITTNNTILKVSLLEAWKLTWKLDLLRKNGWNIKEITCNLITLYYPKEDVTITCRLNKGFDFGHLIEIFNQQAYNFDVNGKNVVDVGMSNGDSSIYFAKKGAKRGVFSCSHLIRELLVKLYQIISNILYCPQVSLV